MRDATARGGVAAGTGLVGRFGDVVILIPGDAGADGPATELLDLVEAAASEAELPGTVIAARLARWVGGRVPDDDTAFAVVAPVADGVVVFLRNAVWADVSDADSTVRLSGQQALTWVDHVVRFPFDRLAIGSEEPVRVHSRSALQGGVVPAQGFVLVPSGAERPDTLAAARTEPAQTEWVPSSTSDALARADALDGSRADESVSAGQAEPPSAAEPAAAKRPGAGRIERQAQNSMITLGSLAGIDAADRSDECTPPGQVQVKVPSAAEPAAAKRPEAVRTERLGLKQPVDAGETTLAAPPVGALISDDGPTVLLDRSYVLGREPHNDPAVRSAAASPIVLRDPDHLVSRVHARVSVDDGSVHVRDALSVSGTFIAAPGAEDWTRVGTEPTQIFPDWSLRIGKVVFVFRATRDANPER